MCYIQGIVDFVSLSFTELQDQHAINKAQAVTARTKLQVGDWSISKISIGSFQRVFTVYTHKYLSVHQGAIVLTTSLSAIVLA